MAGALTTRKANWTNEICALVTAVVDRWSVIRGKFSPSLTNEIKNKAWEEVLQSVNSCNKDARDLKAIKKKWVDLQSHTKKKEAERRRESIKTGGGPAPVPLKDWEEKILSVMNDGIISGLTGGFDTEEIAPSCPSTSSSLLITTVAEVHQADESGDHHTITSVFLHEQSQSISLSSEAMPSKPRQDGHHRESSKKRQLSAEQSQESYSQRLIQIEEEKLSLKKRKLELEKRKCETLDNILAEIRMMSSRQQNLISFSPVSVSPNIKFL